MISCQNCQELLPEFSLGELDASDLRKVRFHVNKCRKCAVELAAYRQVWNTLPFALDPIEPPQELKVQLMDRVKSSPKADHRARPKHRDHRVGSPDSFRLSRKFKWYAIAATLLLCLFALNNSKWGGAADRNEGLFADREARHRVERLAASYDEAVPLRGQDGMPNFVYVSMRKAMAYDALDTRPAAYAIWNRNSDQWHLFLEESVIGWKSRNYNLRLEDARGGLVASASIASDSVNQGGVVFDSSTDRPITHAIVTFEDREPSKNGLSSRQAFRNVIFEADLIVPVLPLEVQ